MFTDIYSNVMFSDFFSSFFNEVKEVLESVVIEDLNRECYAYISLLLFLMA